MRTGISVKYIRWHSAHTGSLYLSYFKICIFDAPWVGVRRVIIYHYIHYILSEICQKLVTVYLSDI